MQGPLRGFHHHLYQIFSRTCTRSCKDPLKRTYHDLYKIFLQGPVQDHARTPERLSSGSLLQLLPRSCTRWCKDLLEDCIWFRQDLHKIFSQGPLQDHKKHLCENSQENAAPQMDPETATQTLCEPAQSKCTWTCHRSHFTPEFRGKIPHTRYMSQMRFHARIYKVKCRRPRPLPTLCPRLRSRNACGHVTRAILCENLF